MTRKLTLDDFLNRAKDVHGEEYDYSKSVLVGMDKKICITCRKHGDFWVYPHNHLRGQKCKYCAKHQSYKKTKEEFIKEATQIHNGKYDYSKVDYVNVKTKVCIICPEHGEFWQTPHGHLQGKKCPKCAIFENAERQTMGKETFIERALFAHGERYDYSKVEYKNNRTKICIICPEHGEFWQSPEHHLRGYGCPLCNNISAIEERLTILLNDNKIHFITQKTFDWLKSDKNWALRYDFYLPDNNIAIECQGIQHFEPVDYFGGEETFKETLERDEAKKRLSDEHGVKVLYFSNLNIDFPYDVITDEQILLNEINRKYRPSLKNLAFI